MNTRVSDREKLESLQERVDPDLKFNWNYQPKNESDNQGPLLVVLPGAVTTPDFLDQELIPFITEKTKIDVAFAMVNYGPRPEDTNFIFKNYYQKVVQEIINTDRDIYLMGQSGGGVWSSFSVGMMIQKGYENRIKGLITIASRWNMSAEANNHKRSKAFRFAVRYYFAEKEEMATQWARTNPDKFCSFSGGQDDIITLQDSRPTELDQDLTHTDIPEANHFSLIKPDQHLPLCWEQIAKKFPEMAH